MFSFEKELELFLRIVWSLNQFQFNKMITQVQKVSSQEYHV